MGSLSVSILHVQCRGYAFRVPTDRADDNDFEPRLQARGGDDAAVTYLRPDNMIAKRVWPNGEAMLDFHVTKSGRSVYVSHILTFRLFQRRQGDKLGRDCASLFGLGFSSAERALLGSS